MRPTALVAASLALASVCFLVGTARAAAGSPDASKAHVVGSPEKLLRHYEDWKLERVAAGDSGRITLPLVWAKGRSLLVTSARGRARIDLLDETISVEVTGLEDRRFVDVWLVRYDPAAGIECGPTGAELLAHLGPVELDGGRGTLVASIGALRGFELEQVVVSELGRHPVEGGLLSGTPGLFQRLLSREIQGLDAGTLRAREVGGLRLGASKSTLGVAQPVLKDLQALVAEGEDLFFNETFGGNGRTCGTCHPAENNFTIDVPFISGLPPGDPLFVAEGNPFLDSTLNGGLVFENPTLMRQFGLIVENPDGFGDLTNRFVMRSVQHTLALALSIKRHPNTPAVPLQRTGWSGDGAPGLGRLRDFAVGAVTQHFPITLGRVPGVDFRLPTPAELNALEAFQLSLGRPSTPDLGQMTFLDPEAEAGKAEYRKIGSCQSCHFDASSNAVSVPLITNGTLNLNFNTGVEAFTQNHPDGTGEPRPVDGGLGTTPEGGFGALVANPDGSYGKQTFNAQSLVELADTLPAFHSNATLIPGSGLPDTVEGAVSFYRTAEFLASPPGKISVPITQTEADQIARFLRVLNALENARSAGEYGARAEQDLNSAMPDLARVTRLADLSQEECLDAVQVLTAIGLHPVAVQDFQDAQAHFLQAMSGTVASRLTEIQLALPLLDSARADMVQ